MALTSIINMYSGMNAAQRGLQVTGHNLSNINTKGYTRQQSLQHDTWYKTVGQGKQIGIGVSLTETRQIRNELTDLRLREQQSVLSFYAVQQAGVNELETILDEPNGESIGKMLNGFWGQMQKLAINPSGVEERLSFLQSAGVLAKKINHVAEGFNQYQQQLNQQITDDVARINQLASQIQTLNFKILSSEINGDQANDYRDERNLLLDALSEHMTINYKEDANGMVIVQAEGRTLIDKEFVAEISLAQTTTLDNPNSGFVKPVWKDTKGDVFDLSKQIKTQYQNDSSSLKSLLILRGNAPANTNTSWDDIAINKQFGVDEEGNAFVIPNLQKKLSLYTTQLTEMVNTVLMKGNGQGIYSGDAGVPVFVPIKGTELVAGNIQVNPLLTENGGYNRLGTSLSGEPGDTTLVEELLEKWSSPVQWFAGSELSKPNQKLANFFDFYAEYISELGTKGSFLSGKYKEGLIQIESLNSDRLSMSAVSQDEELSMMLKYQHAYSAAARVVTVLDSMLDTMINRM